MCERGACFLFALIDTINLSSTLHIISCSLDAVMWSGREYTLKRLVTVHQKCTSTTTAIEGLLKHASHVQQRTVRSAEKIIGANLPTIQDLYTSRVRKRAGKITADPSHPGHKLFKLLPSGRRYRSLFAKTSRHKNSIFPPRRLTTEQLTPL